METGATKYPSSCDVLILGAGLAGLTLALQLRKSCPQAQIVVLEKGKFPVPEAAHRVGESTVEIAAYYFENVLGLREHLEKCQLPKLGLRCFFGSEEPENLSTRVEFGSNTFFPRRTFQIDRGRFENYLAEEVVRQGITLVSECNAQITEVGEEGKFHSVLLRSSQGESTTLESRWLVDASGRAAVLKRKLGMELPTTHHINSAWFRLGCKVSVDDWVEQPSWTAQNKGPKSRWFSTNHLMNKGYWVWIIPVASGAVSIGIVADPRIHPLSEFNTFERACEWLKRHEPRCYQAVWEKRDTLMDFIAIKDFSRNCSQVFSGSRWALTGDCGVFIDPLYSPGSDYIALANTFITDLVKRELMGKRIHGLSQVYNDLFKGFADNTLLAYQDQYELFGNAQVMPYKILWDFATYWGFLAFLFTHDKLCDVSVYSQTQSALEWVSTLNREMQSFFRNWHQLNEAPLGRTREFIDISNIEYIFGLNRELTAPILEAEFPARLHRNIRELSRFGAEIVSRAQELVPQLVVSPVLSGAKEFKAAQAEANFRCAQDVRAVG